MPNLVLLFSHTLTEEQRSGCFEQLGCDNIVEMPSHLQKLWSQIPAELTTLIEYLEPIREWLELHSHPGDFVLVQGDYGATVLFVDFCLKKQLVPVYSTTIRENREERQKDGSVKIAKVFKHHIFRRYEKWPE